MSALLWAVHISDGVLGWPWLAAGFALTGLLVLLASLRVREEEAPRIALLTAAFFVASSIHVKLGPTSGHLLLNGLVGVILGWRAPLAILLGVTLQALLIPHGGISTIGVNAATETVPALLAGMAFSMLYRAIHNGHTWLRTCLVAASAVLWGGCLVFAVVLLATNPLQGLVTWSGDAGLVLSVSRLAPATAILTHPATFAGLGVFALACVAVERRARTAPDFPLGAFLGVMSVLATAGLTGLVLLAEGVDRWSTFVSAVLVLHLPIALLEGLILGCTLSFLTRVKPEMLAPTTRLTDLPAEKESDTRVTASPGAIMARRDGILPLLVLGALLLSARPALAHRLKAECVQVDPASRQVRIESWYETGDSPTDAKARVLRGDGSVLAEGPLDEHGAFTFHYTTAEPLTVQISAPGGHRAECKLDAEQLRAATEHRSGHESADSSRSATARSTGENRLRDLAAGVGLLLGATAFAMSWLNHRQLRRLAALVEKHSSSPSRP
jgi:cobalt/nickel transport system permease protein